MLLSPLEIASGLLLGSDPSLVSLPSAGETPRRALEATLRSALERPPCVVSFSGGRDSSALLAIAVHVARSEGLDQPLPYTMRYPHAPETDETGWQERVVAHLGVTDWLRQEFDDELDLVGPVARGILRRHGLLWPMNAHLTAPAAAAAAGGTLVSGAGGDQVLARSRLARHRELLAGQVLPTPRDLLRVAYAVAPPSTRRAIVRRRVKDPPELPWLRPAAQTAFREGWIRDEASEPIRPREHLRWLLGLRALQVGGAGLARVAADHGARLVNPFLDERFAGALARSPMRGRYADRTRAMRELVGDLLPDEVCARTSKAHFQTPLWNRHARAFAADWDGTGVDAGLVDADALRTHWNGPEPSAPSMTLLQSAWLAADRSASAREAVEPVEQELRRGLEHAPVAGTAELQHRQGRELDQ